MVDPAKQDRALHALHRVLIYLRSMALDGQSTERIAEVLDWAELLPGFLASSKDKTAEFRDALLVIAEREPSFQSAVSVFDSSKNIRW